MDRVAGLYAIYGLDDVILNIDRRMQMRYNILYCISFKSKRCFGFSPNLFFIVINFDQSINKTYHFFV